MWFVTLNDDLDMNVLKQENRALEELSRQLFLESVDLHNEQVLLIVFLYEILKYLLHLSLKKMTSVLQWFLYICSFLSCWFYCLQNIINMINTALICSL